MKVSIESIGSIVAAEFEVEEGLTFLVGNNQAGKSTTLRAIAAVVAAEVSPLTGRVAADAKDMVSNTPVFGPAVNGHPPEILRRDGPRSGSCTVEGEGFRRKIEWRAAGGSDLTGTLESELQVSAIAAGLTRFSELDKTKRYTELANRLEPPSIEDLRAAAPAATNDMIEQVFPPRAMLDWDQACKAAENAHLEAQRAWTALTAKPYSPTAALNFEPDGISSDPKRRTVQFLKGTLVARRDELKDRLAKMVAPVAPETVARWKEIAATKEMATRAVAAAQARHMEASERHDALKRELAAMPEPGLPEQTVLCPCCSKPVVIEGGKLRLPKGGMTAEEQAAAREVRRALGASVDQAQRDRTAATEALATANSKLSAATEHETLLANMAPPSEGAESVKAEYDAVCAEGKALTIWLNATVAASKALAWGELREQLRPRGLRATNLVKQLGRFNELLFRLAKPLGTYLVRIDDEMEVTVNGRPWAPMSGSEKWLADVMIQCVLAHMEDSDWILIDGTDVLAETNRNLLIVRVLRRLAADRHVVLSCAMDDLDAIRSIDESGHVVTLVVRDGTVIPLTSSAQVAA